MRLARVGGGIGGVTGHRVRVASATFLGAASVPGRFPPAERPEIAFAGRSNVGKSSAINRLVGRKKLARTSATPGRTRQLNFFRLDDRLTIVDLPGYGYARVSHAERAAWRPLVESYLASRAVLRGVVLLVDVRRGLEQEEHDLLAFVEALGIPVLVLATKVDKLKQGLRQRALMTLGAHHPDTIPFSSVSGEGVREAWRVLDQWCS